YTALISGRQRTLSRPEALPGTVGHVNATADGGLGLLDLTEPTETAVAAVFAHTAVLAGREGNAEPLAEAGRFFGRLAHLIDAVEDVAEDRAAGAYNPLLATGTAPAEARRHAEDALHGLRLALADVEMENPRLVRALLGREVRRSVDRVFAAYPGAQSPYPPPGSPSYRPGQYPPPHQYPPQGGHGGGGWEPPHGGGGGGWGGGGGDYGHRPPGRRPGWPIPCLTGTAVCVTCGVFQPEWSDYHGESCGERCWCTRHCDGSCDCGGCDGSCCDCCNCCDGCDCCDCGCDC
uniref:DUF5685 family protein n=1 Tax=Actinomadura fibrosa TaxID=111802 RepID=UPI001F5F2B0D